MWVMCVSECVWCVCVCVCGGGGGGGGGGGEQKNMSEHVWDVMVQAAAVDSRALQMGQLLD